MPLRCRPALRSSSTPMSQRQRRDRERRQRHDRRRRPREVVIENRLAVCALILMLAPYGISVPTFMDGAQAGERVLDGDAVVKLPDPTNGYMPNVYTGGTI